MLGQAVQNFMSRTLGSAWRRQRGSSAGVMRVYDRHVAIQFESPDFFRDVQLASLRTLLLHAGQHVPYFRELFGQLGFDPRDVRDVTDIKVLPRLTKDIIRERLNDLVDETVSPADRIRNFTGGSTGAAMEFFQDRAYVTNRGGTTHFSNHMAGWRPGLPSARLWGAPRDMKLHTTPRARLRNWLLNQHQFNTFELSDERLGAYDRSLTRIRPAVMVCYASAAYRLADYLRRVGKRPVYPSRGIITSAEALQPHMREKIEDVFPVRVFDRYACREVSCIASECEAHTGLHVQMLSNVVEIEIEPGADEGDILVTGLWNRTMPLIRYEIGDRGHPYPGVCACGRGTEMIGPVSGRVTDFFVGRGGNYIAGPSLTVLFYGVESIRRYQLIQEDYDRYTLLVVPTDRYDPAEFEGLFARLRLHLGDTATFELHRVDDIPTTESGKHRFIICNVANADSASTPVG